MLYRESTAEIEVDGLKALRSLKYHGNCYSSLPFVPRPTPTPPLTCGMTRHRVMRCGWMGERLYRLIP